jgi:hypothetical protein
VDSLTAHYLARELHERWNGSRVEHFRLDRDALSVVLGAGNSAAVRLDLSLPQVRVYEAEASRGGGALEGYIVNSVTAPLDDRRLEVEFERPGKFRGSASRKATLVVSMQPRARGAALSGDAGQRLGAIGSRLPDAVQPRPIPGAGVVAAAVFSGDSATLAAGRWASRTVIEWLLLDPASAADRYAWICSLPPAEPSRCGELLLPLPICDSPAPATSLVEPHPAQPSGVSPPDDRRERALARMRRELERAANAPYVRAAADQLIALPQGASVPDSVQLAGGASVATDARQGENAAVVAERLYERAAAMERAALLLPRRISEFENSAPRPPENAGGRKAPRAGEEEPGQKLPYRTYRSSGGLEIRVGKNARSNDELTFKRSAPGDVWLHAQGASGSHVILRWTRDESPPARDLEEAAVLAAWHSRARGSALVPVDWTRRRYVRKARGGSPGSVIVTRAETLFARPSSALERTLRDSR